MTNSFLPKFIPLFSILILINCSHQKENVPILKKEPNISSLNPFSNKDYLLKIINEIQDTNYLELNDLGYHSLVIGNLFSTKKKYAIAVIPYDSIFIYQKKGAIWNHHSSFPLKNSFGFAPLILSDENGDGIKDIKIPDIESDPNNTYYQLFISKINSDSFTYIEEYEHIPNAHYVKKENKVRAYAWGSSASRLLEKSVYSWEKEKLDLKEFAVIYNTEKRWEIRYEKWNSGKILKSKILIEEKNYKLNMNQIIWKGTEKELDTLNPK